MARQLSQGTGYVYYDTIDPTNVETPVLPYMHWFNTETEDLFICQNTTPELQVWKKIPKTDQMNAAIAAAIPSRVQSSASRSFNSAFQVDALRDAFVSYSVEVLSELTSSTEETGTIFLEIASDSGFTMNVQEIGRVVNGKSGSLTSGLTVTSIVAGVLSGIIPSAYYVRLRTENTVGTPAFTYVSGQEVLL